MATLRKFTKTFIIALNLLAAVFFLLACCNSFLHPDKWWPLSLFGLVFPVLLLIVFCFMIFWLFLSARKWALISFITLILGWKNIAALFAFHIGSSYKIEKPANALRVLTWNVRNWDEFISAKANTSGHWEKMTDFLRTQNADVMCFQEYFESHNPKELPDNTEFIQKELNYPYYYFSHDYHRYDGIFETGVIIFSRYPLTNMVRNKFEKNDKLRASESLIAADIDVNGKTVRVFTAHLQSVLFQNKDFKNIEIIKNVDDSVFQASKSIIRKLRRAYSARGNQADLVRSVMDSSDKLNIVCGDFNDVPNSYSYFHIRGDMQDAFLKKGFGMGRSYVNLSPTLRIDYIFASPEFKVLQCKNFKLPYSDHHPVVADFELPEVSK